MYVSFYPGSGWMIVIGVETTRQKTHCCRFQCFVVDWWVKSSLEQPWGDSHIYQQNGLKRATSLWQLLLSQATSKMWVCWKKNQFLGMLVEKTLTLRKIIPNGLDSGSRICTIYAWNSIDSPTCFVHRMLESQTATLFPRELTWFLVMCIQSSCVPLNAVNRSQDHCTRFGRSTQIRRVCSIRY